MYKKKDDSETSFMDFNQPLGLKLNPNNRWVRLADMIPWNEYESQYSDLFKSNTGNVAKSFRMALGARIIQKKYDFSDRDLVEEITENPYLQYFIGLPRFQYDPPFDPSLMVAFRKRIDLDVTVFLNEGFLAKHSKDGSKDGDDNDDAGGGISDNADMDNPGNPADKGDDTGKTSHGTLIIDATCAPSDIRFPQDFSLLNEAREKLESIIRRICRDKGERMPRTYCKIARTNYLNLAKSKKRPAKKIRKTIRKQLGYVKRDLGYVDGFIEKGYELLPKEENILQTIRKVYDQQKEMYDEHKHTVANRILSLSQPYIRPIVRGKAKAPVEFGVKFDLSIDEYGMGRIETMSFDPYNEAGFLKVAAENYKERTGHYPERILADQIYRNRENRSYCKERGIRLSGPKLGRPQKDESREEKKLAYKDNTDRIEVERSFSLSKRCYGLGLIRCRLEETSYSDIAMSIFVTNLFRVLNRLGKYSHFLLSCMIGLFFKVVGDEKVKEFYASNAD